MKEFTTSDIDTTGQFTRIHADKADLIFNPPAWMARGLMPSATGYGRKLSTGYSIRFNGRTRRIYVCVFSNCGTSYIVGGGNWNGNIIIDSF